jgi:transcriptional regulator with XRE-family HTH domain
MGYKPRRYPNILRVTRQNAGYQQKQVAKSLGYRTATTLNDWESEWKLPNSTNLMKLCIIYNKTPKELYPEYYERIKQDIY